MQNIFFYCSKKSLSYSFKSLCYTRSGNSTNAVKDAQRTIFQQIFYFGRYRDDCITIWTGDVNKIDLLQEDLNSLDENLKFTVEIGGKSLFSNH